MAQKVGFIGLGSMGRPFATNVVKAGFDLIVYDLRPEPMAELTQLGAKAAGCAREVAEYAEIVDIVVRDGPGVDALMHGADGLLAGAHPGLIAIIHTSLHPDQMERIAAEAKTHGVEMLEAQMSGGVGGVVNRKTCLMVGGDPSLLDQCRPLLETTAANIYLVGGVGAGAIAKIAQNVITAEYLLAASEGFRLAESWGLDLEVFQEIVRTSSAQSYVADKYLGERGSRGAKWMYYDVLWDALDLGHTHDITLPGVATCMQALAHSLQSS
jgi:2-hydroxy-3-oxopropionate reductase